MSSDPAPSSAAGDAPSTDFPPAPWRLRGWGAAAVRGVDIVRARRFVPPRLQIVPVWPGKTLGGIAFLSYEGGSSLVYHELCIVAALVRVGFRAGFWLARLYVDSEASLRGGHEIWSLPKRPARFAIGETPQETNVIARDGEDRVVCRLTIARMAAPRFQLPLMLPLPALGAHQGNSRLFVAKFAACLTPTRIAVGGAHEAIAALRLDRRPLAAFRCADLRLVVPPPRVALRLTAQA